MYNNSLTIEFYSHSEHNSFGHSEQSEESIKHFNNHTIFRFQLNITNLFTMPQWRESIIITVNKKETQPKQLRLSFLFL